jgi:hypothetical protein
MVFILPLLFVVSIMGEPSNAIRVVAKSDSVIVPSTPVWLVVYLFLRGAGEIADSNPSWCRHYDGNGAPERVIWLLKSSTLRCWKAFVWRRLLLHQWRIALDCEEKVRTSWVVATLVCAGSLTTA